MKTASSTFRCRMLEEADIPKLVELNQKKSARLGYGHWLPPLQDEKTKLTFILEEDGELLGALVVREVHEVLIVGDDPRVVLAVEQYSSKMKAVGKTRGITDLFGFIPRILLRAARKAGLENAVERMGFRDIGKEFVLFEGSTESEASHG